MGVALPSTVRSLRDLQSVDAETRHTTSYDVARIDPRRTNYS